MMRLVELERGVWIDESLDPEVRRQVEALCFVMENNLTDAFLALLMFEESYAVYPRRSTQEAWERDNHLQGQRQAELEAQEPLLPGESYASPAIRLSDLAKRDVIRAKWSAGELPETYAHRVRFLHARTFMTSLAQLRRGIGALAQLDTGSARAEITAARDRFDVALPDLKPVRDSIEHAEDRMRGLDKDKQRMTLGPINNGLVNAAGGVLVGDALMNRRYGCTVNDGTYAEVEVADETLETARETVQSVFDALPWRPGHRYYIPRS